MNGSLAGPSEESENVKMLDLEGFTRRVKKGQGKHEIGNRRDGQRPRVVEAVTRPSGPFMYICA